MSVASQISDAMKKLSEGRFEDAIVSASVALSATARLEYPNDKDKAACRKFLEDNLPTICKIGWIAFGISQPINFRYKRLDSKSLGISVRTKPEMLYDVVRCTAIHEATLPGNLSFTEQPLIQTGNDGELVLPIDVIYGLLLAIVGASSNVGEHIAEDPIFSFGGKSVRINELWGRRAEVGIFVGVDA